MRPQTNIKFITGSTRLLHMSGLTYENMVLPLSDIMSGIEVCRGPRGVRGFAATPGRKTYFGFLRARELKSGTQQTASRATWPVDWGARAFNARVWASPALPVPSECLYA